MTSSHPEKLILNQLADGTLVVQMQGDWTLADGVPEIEALQDLAPQGGRVAFDGREISRWDSGLLTRLLTVIGQWEDAGLNVDKSGLPAGVRRMLDLAAAVPERIDARKEDARSPFLQRVGDSAIVYFQSSREMLDFIGECMLVFGRLLRGRARFRRADLFLTIQECGVQAVPIVSLISLLVGLILAFVGAVQLSIFGAQIYVASLVGIAMVRVMGAIMTGIIMAGRTGAAFAAQLGTMEVNEEIDALKTLGISPVEFLVLPRMIALMLMMPLLCLYADLMGILGGLIVGVVMLDINPLEYYQMTKLSVSLKDFWIGLFQSGVFGVLVAVSGCLRGMQCGRSASAVGTAATSAVVTGIVSIIVATAIITMMCNTLGI
jgi:phospholipid/cholesterol/gamma-HCH transport system permease protein